MTKRRLAIYFWIVLSAVACASMPRTTQDAIDEANALITATAQQVTQNIHDGTMSKAEGQDITKELRGYANTVDEATKLLNAGNETEAQQRLRLFDAALRSLHRRVAAKARGGG